MKYERYTENRRFWYTKTTKKVFRVNFQANSFLVLLLCFRKTFQALKVKMTQNIYNLKVI